MGDPEMQQCEQACKKLIDSWLKDVSRLNLDLTKVNAELAKLEAAKTLKLKQADLMKAIETRTDSLGSQILKLDVPEKTPVDLLKPLPEIVQKIIRAGGIPLSDNLTLLPTINLDFKQRKFKDASLKLTWKFN